MANGVHGRGALFDEDPPGLASRVVGVRPYRHRPSPYEHQGDVPFVVLAGARGLGKSLMLDRLRAAYRTHTPVALIDCESARFAAPPAGRPATTWSPVAQALTDIAEQLREPVVQGAGVLRFPRLQAGLLAVSATGWRGGDADGSREETARRILLLDEPRRPWSWVLRKWATRVAAKLISQLTGPAPQAVVEATLETLFEVVWSPRRRLAKAAGWYRNYPGGAGDRRFALTAIAEDFAAAENSRVNAEQWLVRALLADLTAGYRGWWQKSHRLGRPVVLVDNVQSGPGPGLMKAVLDERTQLTDETAFFASLRGHSHPALHHAIVRTLPETARSSGWTRDVPSSSGALLVSLPPLTREEARQVIGDVCAGATHEVDGERRRLEVAPQLQYAIHRLTFGNPLGVALLARTLRQLEPKDPVDPGTLLTSGLRLDERAGGEDPTAYQQLLVRLAPTDHLEELTLLAAAHDGASALAVAQERLPVTFGAGGLNRLRTALAEEGLPPVDGYFVGDPFLRSLLLLRLHLDEDPHRDHQRWQAVHHTLIRHYAEVPGAPDDPARSRFRLHHELALGETGNAVAYLRDTFRRTEPCGWLKTLLFVASAPYYHAHDPRGRDMGAADHRAAVARARTDDSENPPDSVDATLHLTVRRVLHAVWQLNDPLVLPDPEVARRMQWDLEQLSGLWAAGNAALWQTAQDWHEDALACRPLRAPCQDDTADARRDGQ
ncbi:hypothetical protein [Streptomyces sp. NPDC005538]|uniref:hypothetical protein n=1 Tax=unclassified Streptomyces TaxID=2593676 RepID=UPI0033AD4330